MRPKGGSGSQTSRFTYSRHGDGGHDNRGARGGGHSEGAQKRTAHFSQLRRPKPDLVKPAHGIVLLSELGFVVDSFTQHPKRPCDLSREEGGGGAVPRVRTHVNLNARVDAAGCPEEGHTRPLARTQHQIANLFTARLASY